MTLVEPDDALRLLAIDVHGVAQRDLLERHARLADVIDLGIVEVRHVSAAVRCAFEDALRLQHLHRLAQGHTADLQLLREVGLHQPLARPERARGDTVDDDVGHLLRQVALAHERQHRGERHWRRTAPDGSAALYLEATGHGKTPACLNWLNVYNLHRVPQHGTASSLRPRSGHQRAGGRRQCKQLISGSETMRLFNLIKGAAACGLAAVVAASAWAGSDVPAPGQSPKIDTIKERGVLQAAAIGEFPWLPENTTGSGDQFSGPAWVLANEYAKRLGVKLEIVPVSHETKVPILATGEADISIAPLSVTPKRQEVVDFIVYSESSLCFFGLADNPKLKDLKTRRRSRTRADITMAYFTGTPPETWAPTRFPEG